MVDELIEFIEQHINMLQSKLDDKINWDSEQEYLEGCVDASEVILNKVKTLALGELDA